MSSISHPIDPSLAVREAEVNTLPLCVDLDGTLVKSDTLVDSVLALARQNPAALLKIPGWLAQGKASFKRHVTGAVAIDVEALPYNRPLLDFLLHEHAAGRRIYLATAADNGLAVRIAEHQQIFAGVLASDGANNLAGKNKLQAFREQFGERFSYIGNARPDLPILSGCLEPMVANPDAALMAGLRAAKVIPTHIFRDKVPPLKAWLKAIRLHQWAKNALIFLPLLLAHVWKDAQPMGAVVGAAIAFLSFGLCASATYIVNDLLDIEADRRHHSKRRRPFAAGNLSAFAGVGVVVGFLALSLATGAGVAGGGGEGSGSAGAPLQHAGLAGDLRGDDDGVLVRIEAGGAGGRDRAVAAVYDSHLCGRGGERGAGVELAGWIFGVLLPVTGVCKAVCRARRIAAGGEGSFERARLPGVGYRAVTELRDGVGVCVGGGADAVHHQPGYAPVSPCRKALAAAADLPVVGDAALAAGFAGRAERRSGGIRHYG